MKSKNLSADDKSTPSNNLQRRVHNLQLHTDFLNRKLAIRVWGPLPPLALANLTELTESNRLLVACSDLIYLNRPWYFTHAGLLRLARRNRCAGIRVHPVHRFCDCVAGRWAFKATVYKTRNGKGFVGFGDADPANVSPLVRGAEMCVAETRAVNRALRKAYGIGICSVEEIGPLPARGQGGPNVLIRQHRLDASRIREMADDLRNLRLPALLNVLLFLVFCPPCQDRLAGNLAPLFWREIHGTLVTTEFPQSNGVRVFRFLGHSLEKPISKMRVKSRRALDNT
jgi:hypothetical protein